MPTYSKETALYNTGAIGTDIQAAGQTATGYITSIDSNNGVQVHAANNASNNYTQIDANGMNVVNGGTSVASFGETTRIGAENSSNIIIQPDSLKNISYEGAVLFESGSSDNAVSTDKIKTLSSSVSGTVPTTVNTGTTLTLPSITLLTGESNPRYMVTINHFCVIPVGSTFPDSTISLGHGQSVSLSYVSSTRKLTVKLVSGSGGYPIEIKTYKVTATMFGGYLHIGPYGENATVGSNSIAVGTNTKSQGNNSVAVGTSTQAYGNNSFACGESSQANGLDSHAEGYNTRTQNSCAHAEGFGSEANGENSHAQNRFTIAGYSDQTAIGKFNDNQSDTAFEIGNGSGSSSRSNALTVDWLGNLTALGDVSANNLTALGDVSANNFAMASMTRVISGSQSGYEYTLKAIRVGNLLVMGGMLPNFTLTSTYTWTNIASVSLSSLHATTAGNIASWFDVSGGGPSYTGDVNAGGDFYISGTDLMVRLQVSKSTGSNRYLRFICIGSIS